MTEWVWTIAVGLVAVVALYKMVEYGVDIPWYHW